MASVVDELTDREVIWLEYSRGFDGWLASRDITYTRELGVTFVKRALEISDEARREFWRARRPPPKPPKRAPAERHRTDVDELRRFVAERPHLVTRQMKRVFELCIVEGYTLASCAAAMRLSRETVRTRLRRLRERMHLDARRRRAVEASTR